MPPFQDEIGEPVSKGLQFLSSNVTPRKHSVLKAFAPEPAEPSSGRGQSQTEGLPWKASTRPSLGRRVSQIFQDEDEEVTSAKRYKSESNVFGAELEETWVGSSSSTSRPKVTAAFGPESDEGSGLFDMPSSDDEPGSEKDFLPKSDSVFALGWHGLSSFKDATFWKENMDDPKAGKEKRKYDNRKRAAVAQYSRQPQHIFKKNGVDPGRLQKLYNSEKCQCSPTVDSFFLWLSDSYEHVLYCGFNVLEKNHLK